MRRSGDDRDDDPSTTPRLLLSLETKTELLR
jgi:hypothetical protein